MNIEFTGWPPNGHLFFDRFEDTNLRVIYLYSLITFLGFLQDSYAQVDPSHHVAADKQLPASWAKTLYADGPKTWTGDQLTAIGMPCGGIGAGQLYVRGDGTLACWWICNNAYNTGQGAVSCWNFTTMLGQWKTGYQTYTPISFIDQGFTIQIGTASPRRLDSEGFHDICFKGEYPMATITYHDEKEPSPVGIQLKVFSPFIPLDARESATPGTVLQFTIANTSKATQRIRLTGHLQNLAGLYLKNLLNGTIRNEVVRSKGMVSVNMSLAGGLPTDHPYQGYLALSVLDDEGFANAQQGSEKQTCEAPLGKRLTGEAGTTISIKPGEQRKVTFLLTWYFPNRPQPQRPNNFTQMVHADGPIIKNNYANWFKSSLDVAQWLQANLPRLQSTTESFVNAYYRQSNLPYWLTRRMMMPISNLATETTQWWGDGKFWAWEGVGSCYGTCTHVWNYAQGMAHLFPELERNVRERTDLSTSFEPDGRIDMRDGGGGYAIDGQAGTILKAYREHLQSPDNTFVSKNWERIKKAEQYLISTDGNGDGLIEGPQSNTYDIAFYGANTFTGSLYLASLKAASKMAMLMHDQAFAKTCDSIVKNGKINAEKRLWNGHYFIQDLTNVPDKQKQNSQYGTGCLSDQLFGQTWADLDNLGYLYDPQKVKQALQSIYTYNWTPDVGPQNLVHKPERPFANPGEAGLFVCTWPLSPHPGDNGVRYADEVWTGIEYQVATSMIYDGMLDEGLSIVKGLDARYSPEKHNPYNEFECGDHYARSLASYGLLPALEGCTYDGPAQTMGFAPKLQPQHFCGFFTAAEGWGTISQEREGGVQTNTIKLDYGKLTLKQIGVEVTQKGLVTLSANGRKIKCRKTFEGKQLHVSFDGVTIQANQEIKLMIQ
ncbi:MAG: GH116 family glycosyl hydrolase [Bacteroidota bacterium]